ncbi:flagellar biosynthesis protein FlhF [bacterium]|nr:flagellar biosynthesis protein FlhF [bacterium]MBU1958557.1 flagellar biosynthesis protein FlhF [bacterium]
MTQENDNIPVTIEEIQALRAEISLMHESLAHDVIGHAPLLQKVADLFVAKGLDKAWVEKLLAPLVGSSFENDEMLLVAYVLEELDILLKIKDETNVLDKKVHIVVGATGIGKTSLIGKLGARYAYFLNIPYKVAYLNFDRQKVGAVEQLAHYADAMNIPLIVEEDLFGEEYDVILIDTAGSIGKNLSELESLIDIIQRDTAYSVEISLVLSATSKARDLERIVDGFKSFAIDSFVFTKLDETYDLADMINFLIEHNKPISYLSTGQVIPEDLIVASKEYLLNQFMNEE